MLLAWLNRFDGCTLSDFSTSDLTAENAKVEPLALPWRVSAASAYVEFDYGSSVAWRVFAVLGAAQGNDLGPTATIRVRLSNTAPLTGDLYDSTAVAGGIVDGYPQIYHTLSADVTARYGRIDLAQAGATTIDVGRIFGGPAWIPARTVSFGYGLHWRDTSEVSRSLGGQAQVNTLARFRELSFVLRANTLDDMVDQAAELDRLNGVNKPILVRFDEIRRPQQFSVYGYVARTDPIIGTAYNRARRGYLIQEAL